MNGYIQYLQQEEITFAINTDSESDIKSDDKDSLAPHHVGGATAQLEGVDRKLNDLMVEMKFFRNRRRNHYERIFKE